MIWTACFWFVLGLGALVLGAEWLVGGAVRLARRLGLSPLVIGLTVVAVGTSAPELAVSAKAALAGQADLAVGNVVGSNICNVLLILGAAAVITPLQVARGLVRRDIPMMIALSLGLWWCAGDGVVSRPEATLLLALLVAHTGWILWQGRRSGPADAAGALPAAGFTRRVPSPVLVAVGLGLLVAGAGWLVDGATVIARQLGASEVVIGLTMVAVGTSLPELVTSLVAARRGERDIAVGNVIGSNVFNILGVVGFAGVLAPAGLGVAPGMLHFDLPVMVGCACLCLPLFARNFSIPRWQGALFLLAYVGYVLALVAPQLAA